MGLDSGLDLQSGDLFASQLDDGEHVVDVRSGDELGAVKLFASDPPPPYANDELPFPPTTGGKDDRRHVVHEAPHNLLRERSFVVRQSAVTAEAFIHPQREEVLPRPLQSPSFALVS
jgi:hypothetical protein